jgi:effector-binding domain-containing protein
MQVEIHNGHTFDVHGFSERAVNKDYTGTAFKLMDKMWQVVKSNNLKNKGLNVWVYESNDIVFGGVELNEPPTNDSGLEHKSIILKKYAYYKHVGPYSKIKETGQAMRRELENKGLEIILPYIEVYGHWSNDETKLETELYMCLK